MPLSFAREGEKVRIAGCRGKRLQERLLSMGIRIMEELELVCRHGHGAVIISQNGNRYGLGGGMAHKIFIVKG